MNARETEVEEKLKKVRSLLEKSGDGALRLRGSDWFAWATGGASNVVLLTTDQGVAEILITASEAIVLTDTIEAQRLRDEELPKNLRIESVPWQRPDAKDAIVRSVVEKGRVVSDAPGKGEFPLSEEYRRLKYILDAFEIERYRRLGREAAEAMTETLAEATPEWTGYQLAGRGAKALWDRGIHPALTLVGDERRLPIYRHPTASQDKIGSRAMLVFCARRGGLYANLTRFVAFRDLTSAEIRQEEDLGKIEAEVFAVTAVGQTLGSAYAQLAESYRRYGYAGEIDRHHQGGSCGYLSREVVARPNSPVLIENGMAFAWNPSLTGGKIEDTVILNEGRLEILTKDEAWPSFLSEGRSRPACLVRRL